MKNLFFSACILSSSIYAQNTVCFEIEANPNTNDLALGAFTKYVNVLDCFEIYAEASISDAKVLHAAAVTAELLDNNEDGIVDDPLIKAQLANSNALMPLFASEGSAGENAFFNNYNGNGVSAVLYNNEIDPTQPGHWGDDATVEEILHTINHIGHTFVYPNAFSLSPNSSLMSDAMDVARGGQFMSIPSSYPEDAWYHYDDYTCDYECMAIEYMYWAIVSNMGILNDTQTCSGIANEWEPCSPELFESMDILMHTLITDPQYLIPQNAPDGNYCPASVGINKNYLEQNLISPNPCTTHFSYYSNSDGQLSICAINGRLLSSVKIQKGMNTIGVSDLINGVYILKHGNSRQKLIIR